MLRGLNLTRGWSTTSTLSGRVPLPQHSALAGRQSFGPIVDEAVSMRTVLVDLLICQGRSCDESARARSL
jgi:hypothetical protein